MYQEPEFKVTIYYDGGHAWRQHGGYKVGFTDLAQNTKHRIEKDGVEPTPVFSNIPIQHPMLGCNPEETNENRHLREKLENLAVVMIRGMGFVEQREFANFPYGNLTPLKIDNPQRLYARHSEGHLVPMDAYVVRQVDGFIIYNVINIGD